MSDYNFSHTFLSNLNCIKKANYYVNKVPGINSFEANAGIDLHKIVEDYLKTLRDPQDLKPTEYVKFLKLKPYLDEIIPFLLSVEGKKDRNDDVLGKVPARFDAVIDSPDGLFIVDWKFVGKPWDASKFDWYKLHQALLYLWVVEFEYHKTPDGMIFKVVPDLGPVQTFDVPWLQSDIDRAMNYYKSRKQTFDTYRRMNKFPANPTPLCGWCSWKEICDDRWKSKAERGG